MDDLSNEILQRRYWLLRGLCGRITDGTAFNSGLIFFISLFLFIFCFFIIKVIYFRGDDMNLLEAEYRLKNLRTTKTYLEGIVLLDPHLMKSFSKDDPKVLKLVESAENLLEGMTYQISVLEHNIYQLKLKTEIDILKRLK